MTPRGFGPTTKARMNYTTHPTHISNIRPGNTVVINDQLRTVCASDIKHGFMGRRTLFGDCYALGNKPVSLATIFHAKP